MTGAESKPGASPPAGMGKSGADSEPESVARESPPLYFFPDQEVSSEELRRILDGDDAERRAWVVSHLLRYAQWDDIWIYVSREEVRSIFSELDLPDNLRLAWGRMLKVEVSPVG